jgi:hypothetical protein
MRKYFLLIFYVVISLLIGKDFHPFSMFPMYNSFPNYSYVFYLKNEKDSMVPFFPNFLRGKNAGALAHQYGSFFSYHHYVAGFGQENRSNLNEAGKDLMETLLQGEPRAKFGFDTLFLYKRYYHLDHDSINYRDDLIYEQAVKP